MGSHERPRQAVGSRRGEFDLDDLFGEPRLPEREGQRRPAVPDPVGEGLRSMDMSERGVVRVREDGRRCHADSAQGDVALRLTGDGARDEGVRQHDEPITGGVRVPVCDDP